MKYVYCLVIRHPAHTFLMTTSQAEAKYSSNSRRRETWGSGCKIWGTIIVDVFFFAVDLLVKASLKQKNILQHPQLYLLMFSHVLVPYLKQGYGWILPLDIRGKWASSATPSFYRKRDLEKFPQSPCVFHMMPISYIYTPRKINIEHLQTGGLYIDVFPRKQGGIKISFHPRWPTFHRWVLP